MTGEEKEHNEPGEHRGQGEDPGRSRPIRRRPRGSRSGSGKGYEDLHVWRESLLLAVEVHAAVAGFGEAERRVMGDPIRAAAAAVAMEIAEGQVGIESGEFLPHLGYARGELARLHTLLVLAEQLGHLDVERLRHLEEGLHAVSRPLQGLIDSLHPPSNEAGSPGAKTTP